MIKTMIVQLGTKGLFFLPLSVADSGRGFQEALWIPHNPEVGHVGICQCFEGALQKATAGLSTPLEAVAGRGK